MRGFFEKRAHYAHEASKIFKKKLEKSSYLSLVLK